jgi:hypothetical protein
MAKRSRVVLLDIAVDRESEVPLQRQVYLAIRRLILVGGLKPGARLPSTRVLANELHLARTTVLLAEYRAGLLCGWGVVVPAEHIDLRSRCQRKDLRDRRILRNRLAQSPLHKSVAHLP